MNEEKPIYGIDLISVKAVVESIKNNDMLKQDLNIDKMTDLEIAQLAHFSTYINNNEMYNTFNKLYGKINYKTIQKIFGKYFKNEEVSKFIKLLPNDIFKMLLITNTLANKNKIKGELKLWKTKL